MDKALSLRIFPEDLKAKLKILAIERATTLNQLIVDILEKAVREEKS